MKDYHWKISVLELVNPPLKVGVKKIEEMER